MRSAGIIFVSDIQAVVAREFKAPADCMTEPDGASGQRSPERVVPRQAAMALALDLTRHGPSKIGRLFGGRDHSTVCHAKAATEVRRATDEDFDQRMRRVTLVLVRRGHA